MTNNSQVSSARTSPGRGRRQVFLSSPNDENSSHYSPNEDEGPKIDVSPDSDDDENLSYKNSNQVASKVHYSDMKTEIKEDVFIEEPIEPEKMKVTEQNYNVNDQENANSYTSDNYASSTLINSSLDPILEDQPDKQTMDNKKRFSGPTNILSGVEKVSQIELSTEEIFKGFEEALIKTKPDGESIQSAVQRPTFGVEHNSTYSVSLTPEDAAFLLGKAGHTKRKLSKVSQCTLDLHNNDLRLDIKGESSNREKAILYVKLILKQRLGVVDADENLEERDDTTVLKIPHTAVGYVTGSHGAVLRRVEDEWNTLMFFVGELHGIGIGYRGSLRRKKEASLNERNNEKKSNEDLIDNSMGLNETNKNSTSDLESTNLTLSHTQGPSDTNTADTNINPITEGFQQGQHAAENIPKTQKGELKTGKSVENSPNLNIINSKSIQKGNLDKYYPLETLIIFGELRNRKGAELKIMSAVEQKCPGFYTNHITEDYHSEDEGFRTDVHIIPHDRFSYTLGKEGKTRRKLARASGCIIEYIGYIAFMSGYKPERTRAMEYLNFLTKQRTEKVDVDTEERDDVTVLYIPQEHISNVSGAYGNNLRMIEDKTGTFIFFDGQRKNSNQKEERLLIFCWEELGRLSAKTQILDILSYSRNSRFPNYRPLYNHLIRGIPPMGIGARGYTPHQQLFNTPLPSHIMLMPPSANSTNTSRYNYPQKGSVLPTASSKGDNTFYKPFNTSRNAFEKAEMLEASSRRRSPSSPLRHLNTKTSKSYQSFKSSSYKHSTTSHYRYAQNSPHSSSNRKPDYSYISTSPPSATHLHHLNMKPNYYSPTRRIKKSSSRSASKNRLTTTQYKKLGTPLKKTSSSRQPNRSRHSSPLISDNQISSCASYKQLPNSNRYDNSSSPPPRRPPMRSHHLSSSPNNLHLPPKYQINSRGKSPSQYHANFKPSKANFKLQSSRDHLPDTPKFFNRSNYKDLKSHRNVNDYQLHSPGSHLENKDRESQPPPPSHFSPIQTHHKIKKNFPYYEDRSTHKRNRNNNRSPSPTPVSSYHKDYLHDKPPSKRQRDMSPPSFRDTFHQDLSTTQYVKYTPSIRDSQHLHKRTRQHSLDRSPASHYGSSYQHKSHLNPIPHSYVTNENKPPSRLSSPNALELPPHPPHLIHSASSSHKREQLPPSSNFSNDKNKNYINTSILPREDVSSPHMRPVSHTKNLLHNDLPYSPTSREHKPNQNRPTQTAHENIPTSFSQTSPEYNNTVLYNESNETGYIPLNTTHNLDYQSSSLQKNTRSARDNFKISGYDSPDSDQASGHSHSTRQVKDRNKREHRETPFTDYKTNSNAPLHNNQELESSRNLKRGARTQVKGSEQYYNNTYKSEKRTRGNSSVINRHEKNMKRPKRSNSYVNLNQREEQATHQRNFEHDMSLKRDRNFYHSSDQNNNNSNIGSRHISRTNRSLSPPYSHPDNQLTANLDLSPHLTNPTVNSKRYKPFKKVYKNENNEIRDNLKPYPPKIKLNDEIRYVHDSLHISNVNSNHPLQVPKSDYKSSNNDRYHDHRDSHHHYKSLSPSHRRRSLTKANT